MSKSTIDRLQRRTVFGTSTSALAIIVCSLAWSPLAFAQAANGPVEQDGSISDTPTTQANPLVPAAAEPDAARQEARGDQDIVVTGSRIAVDGTRAPTPVTVVSQEQLQLAAPRTITDGLLQLPVFAGSQSVQNQSTGTTTTNGGAYLNLRGLGTSRTLVLLDGRRIVPATSIGSVDVSLIPEALVQRVEVVTGGASAAYGSDAVSGVVNYILNTGFRGIKGDVQTGISERGDNENYKVSLAAGHSFMDDRLSVIGSFEHYDSGGVETADQRAFARRGTGIINNPNVDAQHPASPDNPARLVVVNPLASNASLGGLITNTILAGTTFDPDGSARAFQYGDYRTSTQMAGSDDPNAYNPNRLLVLQPAQKRTAGFAHVRYKFGDAFNIDAEALLSRNDVHYASLPTFELSQTAFTVFQDNAFLPESVRQKMAANNIQSVSVGRVSPDFATPTLDGKSVTQRYVVGADGKLGGDWTYKAYYQYGQNHSVFKTLDDPISRNLYRAADSVVDPTTGAIVCRSTLTNPGDGCVPLNIFGNGNASAAALDYITGTAVQDVTVKQHVAEASVQGSLFKLPGGNLGVAVGVGYRKERFDQTVDAISSINRTGEGIRGFPSGLENTLGGYERSNPQPAAGGYSVKEVFGEVNAPILADVPFATQLTLNGAMRYTDYSTSGGVTTWKVGAVYEPVRGLRFRGTRSRDIRAPSLGELYRGSSQGTATIMDPTRGGETTNALTGAVGNPNLTPEIADTTVLGVVFQPAFLPGLHISVDHYDIKIRDALSALDAQRTVDLCAAGATDLCSFIQRDDAGRISRIELPFFNVDFTSAEGVDFEASYAMPVGSANLNLRAIVTRLISRKTQAEGTDALELAGSGDTPKWTGIASANLALDRFSLFVQERYVGPVNFTNYALGDVPETPSDLNINRQGSVFYTDLTASFDLDPERRIHWFLTVNNLLDRDPPQTPSYLIAGSSYGNRTLYDQIGRMYTTGVRFQF